MRATGVTGRAISAAFIALAALAIVTPNADASIEPVFTSAVGGDSYEPSGMMVRDPASGTIWMGVNSAGQFPQFGTVFADNEHSHGFHLVRFAADGTPLSSRSIGHSAWFDDMAIAPDGSLIAVGYGLSGPEHPRDAPFVAAVDPAGTGFAWTRRLDDDGLAGRATAVDVDGSGAIYIVGSTGQSQDVYDRGGEQTVLLKLEPRAAGVVYRRTFTIDPVRTLLRDIDVAPNGGVVVSGGVGGDGSVFNGPDAFVLSVDPQGVEVLRKFIRGSCGDSAVAAPAPDGSIYLAGATASEDFPIKRSPVKAPELNCLRNHAFIAKLDAKGSLAWSSVLDAESAADVEVDPSGSPVISGTGLGPGFPPVGTPGGGHYEDIHAFVLRATPDGQSFSFAAPLGGGGSAGGALALAGGEDIYLAGNGGPGLPAALPSPYSASPPDPFVAKLHFTPEVEAPVAEADSVQKQRGKIVQLRVRAGADEAVRLRLSGSMKVGGAEVALPARTVRTKFHRIKRTRLMLSRKASSRVLAKLARGARGSADLKVVMVDSDGSRSSSNLQVKVR